MENSLYRWYITASLIPAVAAIYYIAVFAASIQRLPAEVPVHFGLDGIANGWMNRYVWAIASLVVIVSILGLVFTTQPIPPTGALEAETAIVVDLMFWSAYGLVIGAFLAINRAATTDQPLRLLSILLWVGAVPLLEVLAAFALRGWWQR